MSLGNKADVSSNDLLEYWEDDAATSVVALYLESFGNPVRFGRIARRVARHKPVLALKGGATAAGARAAASHTAALASSDAAVDALFRQSGVLRTRTLSEFLDAALLLSSQPLPLGPRVAVVTNAGGLGILFSDACAAEGLELPEPSAATRAGAARASCRPRRASRTRSTCSARRRPRRSPPCSRRCSRIPAFDAVCVLFVRPVVATAADVERAVDRAAAEAGGHKPVVARAALERAAGASASPHRSIATFASPEAAARALGVARAPGGVAPATGGCRPGAARRRPRDRARRRRGGARRRTRTSGSTPRRAGALLEAYGIPLAPEVHRRDARRGGAGRRCSSAGPSP